MKHKILLICLFIIGITELYSQYDFREGFIIDYNNDTIYGWIAHQGDQGNSKRCVFKKESHSPIQRFNPDELIAYQFINGKYYISKPIPCVDKDSLLFVEYLINGIVNVFYYRDDLAGRYLIEDEDKKLYELKNEKLEIIKDGTYIRNSNEFRGVLTYLFKDAPSVSKMAENTSLSHKSLIKISKEYHNTMCPDKECIIYEKKSPEFLFHYGFIVGAHSISKALVTDISDEYYYLPD